MIPRTFHRIWLDEPIPDKFQAFWDAFQRMHPAWDFVTWRRSEALDWLSYPEIFRQQTNWAGRSDVLRYEVLAKFGGVYVDTDVEPLRPFDDLLADERPFAGWESDRLICPTVVGAPAAHPAIVAVTDALPAWWKRYRNRPPNQATGPHLFTAVWKGRTDVRLMPRTAFYPVGWWERDQLNGDYPETSYAVHHWNQGWDLQGKARIDARQRR